MIIISLFQFIILKLVTSLDYSSMIPQLMQQLPENITKTIGDDFLALATVEGAASFGLNHPLTLVILCLAAILIPSRHIAGEIENGTLELVLSFPIRRTRLMLNLYASALVLLFLIIFCGLCASLASIAIFHQLTFELFLQMLKVCTNLWLLIALIISLTMVLSSYEKEGNKVGVRVAGIVLFFYLLHYLSTVWDALRFSKPFNIFSYYQPKDLMSGDRSILLHLVVLLSLILICLLVSLFQFNRRDIPG